MSVHRGVGMLVAPLAVAMVATGCGGSTTKASTTAGTATGCSVAGEAATATTRSYRLVLDVGRVEEMYARSYVRSHHPTGGEVMLGGTMTMASGPDARHLEVHICQRSNDHVVQGADPVLRLKDTTAGSSQAVPVSTMEGVGSGPGDLHYGNNVVLAPGHSYTLAVSVGGQRASLAFTEPAASGSSSTTSMGSMKMGTTTTTTGARATSTTARASMHAPTTAATVAGRATSTTGMGGMKMTTTTGAKATSTTYRP